MGAIIYGLCTLTSFWCAFLLLKAHQQSRYRLLLWGGVCFAGLTVSNALLVVDKIFLPVTTDLSGWRYGISLLSMMILIYGLIWEKE